MSQHRAVIFLSSSCPCLTLHCFYVPVRSNRVAQGDGDVCFVSVNGHHLWFMWFTGQCYRNNCLIWRRVVSVGDLTCLANLWHLWFICSGKNDNNIIRIFEYKTNLIVTENQVVPAVLTAAPQCFFWNKPLLYVHKDLWICLKMFYYVLLKLQSRCKAMALVVLLEEFMYTSNHAYICHFSF